MRTYRLSLGLTSLGRGLLRFPGLSVTRPSQVAVVLRTSVPFVKGTFLRTLRVFRFTVNGRVVPFFTPRDVLGSLLSVLNVHRFTVLRLSRGHIPFTNEFCHFQVNERRVVREANGIIYRLIINYVRVVRGLRFKDYVVSQFTQGFTCVVRSA